MQTIIMAVDDDKHVLSSLGRMFRKDSYTFVSFHSPVIALESLTKVRPHVIISDRKMPGIEGEDFLTLASEMLHCSLRILLTGFRNSGGDSKDAIDMVFTKPWINEQLEFEINRSRFMPNRIDIPLIAYSGFIECSLCGSHQANWEIRMEDCSEHVCSRCYERLMHYFDSAQESILMKHMLGNVI